MENKIKITITLNEIRNKQSQEIESVYQVLKLVNLNRKMIVPLTLNR